MDSVEKILNTTKNHWTKKEIPNPHQRLIAGILGSKPIAFNPDLVKITKSINGAILLGQLLYWHRKGSNPEWIYKTIKEMEEETSLTRAQQDLAIKKCKKLNFIEVRLKGIPAKRHFKVNVDEIIKSLRGIVQIDGLSQQDCRKQTNSFTAI